ncbi:DUF1192 domain-containing protein [Neorhizobium galegae]|uniref:DUF1192 domain-containing protein n=1 Tax=Neorhizobium galegae TaxID=399 RepID=UPI000622056F|nr:DUF1192 domain-containing protein [Neorhizobium galegae]CDZ30560.1 Hypothetical protein NGAL_HAMBI490_54290 [Neorhizobium galegae bv. officinalis]KAA9388201.1 DUF1192 domain-containing protein [Neorhizobium galegae]KAB1109962.1 DUF1192 domain-containing protein [Neorhizobium galegae]MCM2501167.1 DUF1192 domain-containing protein [Neorhizobium galegae]MCQ1766213.1 DUF1192 domain-containing protein [Neorhizobium galegae]
MSFIDDERPKKPATHELGSDLSMLSVDELESRIGLLRQEIARLEAEKETKAAGRRAADSLFRS